MLRLGTARWRTCRDVRATAGAGRPARRSAVLGPALVALATFGLGSNDDGSVGVGVGSVAHADPVRAAGEAKGSEWKQVPDASVVRKRALRRARTQAIKTALASVQGGNREARQAIVKQHSAWTGSYRVLSETRPGDAVRLQIEVDIDLARLTKHVAGKPAPGRGARPRFSLGLVKGSADGMCGDTNALPTLVAEELGTVGAIAEASAKGAVPVDLNIACQALGPVRFTSMHAARVEIAAVSEGRTVATLTRESFAEDGDAAVRGGLAAALFAVGAELATHQRGRVRVRIDAPGPADRVRRLERTIRDKVLGVSKVAVAGLTPGQVVLAVQTELTAATLAKRLSGLSLPDFSVTILGVEEPDVVTIAFH